MTVWTVNVLALHGKVSLANEHFRLHHYAKGKVTKGWRDAGFWAAAEHKLPKGLPVCNMVSRVVYPKNKLGKLPDTTAWFPTTKAIVDGLVDYGCWPDDDAKQGIKLETFAPAVRSRDVTLQYARVEIRLTEA